MDESKIDIINPFGPAIAKVKMPENIVNKLNEYVDEIVNNKELSKKFDHGKNLIGNVKQEISLSKEIIEKSGLLSLLANATRAWIKYSLGQDITKFNIDGSWVVRQFSNEYNPVHWHGGHISGAGFLKLPSTFGETFQKEKKNLNGKLIMIHGSRSFMSNSKYEVKPEVGDFYIFPHYLMHAVYPFKDTNEERRSISFNATIDDKSFDVFV